MFSPQNEIELRDTVEVLAKALMLIILDYINVSDQQVVYLKLTQCYMSIISL